MLPMSMNFINSLTIEAVETGLQQLSQAFDVCEEKERWR